MSTTATVLFIVLAVVFAAGGAAAVAKAGPVRQIWDTVGIGAGLGQTTGVLELFAAAGLVIGVVAVPALGVAAAIGLVLVMIGAIAYHVRAGDWAGVAVPALLGIVATAAAVTAWPAVGG